jgi:hypothetical protein
MNEFACDGEDMHKFKRGNPIIKVHLGIKDFIHESGDAESAVIGYDNRFNSYNNNITSPF